MTTCVTASDLSAVSGGPASGSFWLKNTPMPSPARTTARARLRALRFIASLAPANHPARHAEGEQARRQQEREADVDERQGPARQQQRAIRRLRDVDVELLVA